VQFFDVDVDDQLPAVAASYRRYPVIRIPIAGPEPYNTLACVRQITGPGGYVDPSPEEVYRTRVTISTPLVLRGNDDPREIPPSAHSTSVAMFGLSHPLSYWNNSLNQVEKAEFVYRDQQWVWRITTIGDVGVSDDRALHESAVYATSWVLLHEPREGQGETPSWAAREFDPQDAGEPSWPWNSFGRSAEYEPGKIPRLVFPHR
jgi:hypothetical protein